MPRNKPQPSQAKMEAADRKLRANATYDDKKGNPNNTHYDAFLKLLEGLTIGTFTFPQATETNDGEMTESKWVSTKNLVPVCPISQTNADYRHYVWLAVHMLIKVKLPHITEGTTRITKHINKGMLTIKSDTVFTENDIITGLDKAGYVRKTLADPLADVSTTIQNHLLTTIKGRKFEVCATGDKSVASVIG